MKVIIPALLLLVTLQVHGHGEDKPGPHGGYISMPGAFHVELVPESGQILKAYLLDMEWKNPVVKNSSVAISHGPTAARCMTKQDHFECEFPKSVNLKKPGKLSVTAKRDNSRGNKIDYALPFRLMKHH